VFEGGVSADYVVHDGRTPSGHVQPHRALFLISRPPLATESTLSTVQALVGGDVIRRCAAAVGVPALQERLERLLVASGPFALEDRPLIPIELEPAQGVEDLLDVLGGGALAVGVLDAQYERPAAVLGEQPVEQRCAGAPDVQRARGGWSKANPHKISRQC